MNQQRRFIVAGLTSSLVLGLAGCATGVFQSSYTEEVSVVLISEDKKKLVFLGKDYHYIFDVPPLIVKTLESSFHRYVTGTPFKFHVEKDEQIWGSFKLTMPANAPQHEKSAAIAAGYKEIAGYSLIAEPSLRGKRYLAGNFKTPESLKSLNKSHSVYITLPQTKMQKRREATLTPIMELAGGIIGIGLAPLYVVGGTFLVVMCGNGGCR